MRQRPLNQPNSKRKPTVTWSHAFFRASGRMSVLIDWRFSFVLILWFVVFALGWVLRNLVEIRLFHPNYFLVCSYFGGVFIPCKLEPK